MLRGDSLDLGLIFQALCDVWKNYEVVACIPDNLEDMAFDYLTRAEIASPLVFPPETTGERVNKGGNRISGITQTCSVSL